MQKEETDPDGKHQVSADEDELSQRRSHLSAEIEAAKRNQISRNRESDPLIAPVTSAAGMALGLRLSSAFVGTIVAGGLLGWLIDHLFATSPLGLIVLICLGFIGGFLNLLRVLNQQKTGR